MMDKMDEDLKDNHIEFMMHVTACIMDIICWYKFKPSLFIITEEQKDFIWYSIINSRLAISTIKHVEVINCTNTYDDDDQLIPILIKFNDVDYFSIIKMGNIDIKFLELYDAPMKVYLTKLICNKRFGLTFDIPTSTIINMLKCMPNMHKYICAYCFTKTRIKLEKCARCLAIYYCSRLCQGRDWKEHMKTCKKYHR